MKSFNIFALLLMIANAVLGFHWQTFAAGMGWTVAAMLQLQLIVLRD